MSIAAVSAAENFTYDHYIKAVDKMLLSIGSKEFLYD